MLMPNSLTLFFLSFFLLLYVNGDEGRLSIRRSSLRTASRKVTRKIRQGHWLSPDLDLQHLLTHSISIYPDASYHLQNKNDASVNNKLNKSTPDTTFNTASLKGHNDKYPVTSANLVCVCLPMIMRDDDDEDDDEIATLTR